MTKLYLHDALTGDTGTLPTTSQSALGTPTVTSDAVTVNRSMDTTIGVSQASKALTTGTTNPADLYFTRFVSSPMNITSLAADTWTFSFAASQSSTSVKFPYNTSASNQYICLYVWRPSNGTKIATILDSNTGSTNTSASTGEIAYSSTFSGGAVSFASQDILCFECIFDIVWSRVSGTGTFFYDGTTEASASSCASFLNSPGNTITFGGSSAAKIFPNFFTTKAPQQMITPRFFPNPSNLPPMFVAKQYYSTMLRTINKPRLSNNYDKKCIKQSF